MKLKLTPISLNEVKSDDLFQSEECQQLLAMYDDFYLNYGFEAPWIGYFVMMNDTIVGSCGFVGKPQNGEVEIAYWTFKVYEGQGMASFACEELLKLAYHEQGDIIVNAKTAPEHNSSTKILEKNCFVYTKIVQDHEIGDAWLWTHKPK